MVLTVLLKDKEQPVVLNIEKFYYDYHNLIAVYSNGIRKFWIDDVESFDVEEEIPELL